MTTTASLQQPADQLDVHRDSSCYSNRGVIPSNGSTNFLPHQYVITLVPRRSLTDQDATDHLKNLVASYLARRGAPAGAWHRPARSWCAYRQSWQHPNGVRISYDPITLTKDRRRHFQLALQGHCCDLLTLADQRQLAAQLAGAFDVRCCRIDLAFDTSHFTVQDVWNACNDGSLRAKFHIKRDTPNSADASIRQIVEKHLSGTTMTTVYLGRRMSERMARVYDRRSVVRFELELKDGRADRCFRQIILGPAADAAISGQCMGLVRDFVDFIDRRSAGPINQCNVLSWWASFTGSVPIVRQPAPMVAKDPENTKAWLSNSIAPILAAIANREPDPEQYVLDLYRAGERRQKDRHRRLTGKPMVIATNSSQPNDLPRPACIASCVPNDSGSTQQRVA